MGVPKVILMRRNEDGTEDQVYPVTHINAVDGLSEVLSKKNISLGVTSINGQSGDVKLPIMSEHDYLKVMSLVEAYENGELNRGNITFERVDEV